MKIGNWQELMGAAGWGVICGALLVILIFRVIDLAAKGNGQPWAQWWWWFKFEVRDAWYKGVERGRNWRNRRK